MDENTRGGTQAHNLLLRREAPYPLGHTSHDALALRLAMMHTTWPTAEALLKKDLDAYNSSPALLR